MPAKTKSAPAAKSKKAPATRLSLAEVMATLEKAGSEQTRKTYARHGAPEPMFGVSFATLKTLYKRIGVDHELALALWETGNFDARNLAVKVVDPARMSPADLDRWAKAPTARMCHGYVAAIASEGPHARAKADAWLASPDEGLRSAGWLLVAAMANRDESTPDSWFTGRLAEIEKSIRTAPNEPKAAMNQAVIGIGFRNASLRKAATAAAKRIGPVEVDHGDTACKTPDAAAYIDKAWVHSLSKKFESPAAHERTRESMRTRC
ncbi:MAG: DNA alkylation repair protein [Planctomycetes bacterium]|nr:DNA alkylation repair protein [Planctomycetota bacterium]